MAAIEPFQDFAKSLDELRKLVRALVGDSQALWQVYQKRKGKNTAASLDVLTFQGGGSRLHLERIIAGTASQEDFAAIAAKLDETSEPVEEALDKLKRARAFVREKYGLNIANNLSDLVYGLGGKSSIRIDLWQLVSINESVVYDEEIAQENARRVLKNIEELNVRIEQFHDMLLNLKEGKA